MLWGGFGIVVGDPWRTLLEDHLGGLPVVPRVPPLSPPRVPTADREVQRILLELLNQMDGFDQNVNVKVIMATNRADTLDPALLRPGRLDRKIEFPLPDRRQKRLIFSTITGKMNLSEEVDLEDCILNGGYGVDGGNWGNGVNGGVEGNGVNGGIGVNGYVEGNGVNGNIGGYGGNQVIGVNG
ncbi:26S proteasome regulatory subunit 4-like, partial [Phasianus colchicus]|uniref:26S proteasome regulatory subunit 4-like n=1 Tax=Phasianus colchicus TaxID=9054 RepID=UPI00129E06EA